MNTRRSILKLIGAAPVGAASVKGEIASMLASPAVVAAASIASATLPQVPGQHLGIIGTQLNKLARQARQEQDAKRASRYGQPDPDIACLRSMSAVNKARLQYERDTEEASMFQRIDEVLYGN